MGQRHSLASEHLRVRSATLHGTDGIFRIHGARINLTEQVENLCQIYKLVHRQ